MKEVTLPFPELALIAGTRAALGFGLGLLLADRLTPEQRQAAGLALVAVGVLTTIPLAADVLGRRKCDERVAPQNRSPWPASAG